MPAVSHPDVAIVGGGILGVSCAYYLTARGLSVTVLERESIGGRASGRALGTIPPSTYSSYYASKLNSLARQRHFDLVQELSGRYFFILRSLIQIAVDDESQNEVDKLLSDGVDTAPTVDGATLLREEPRLSPDVRGGLLFENTVELDSLGVTKAIWGVAADRGATLLATQADTLLTSGARVTGVRTSAGDTVLAGTVILANGAWLKPLLKNSTGIELPLEPYRGEIVRLQIDGRPLKHIYYWGTTGYASTKPDGLTWVGTTMESAGFADTPTKAAGRAMLTNFANIFPGMGEYKQIAHTACLRPMTPDGLPFCGSFTGLDNLLLVGGAGRNGILQGPLLGEMAATLLTDGTGGNLLESLSPNRFL